MLRRISVSLQTRERRDTEGIGYWIGTIISDWIYKDCWMYFEKSEIGEVNCEGLKIFNANIKIY